MWGDSCILQAVAMMWGLRISIVQPPPPDQMNVAPFNHIQIRHTLTDLFDVNLVLVYNGRAHYSSVGECNRLGRWRSSSPILKFVGRPICC